MTPAIQDGKGGVIVDIKPNTINSLLIGEVLVFLTKCRQQKIAVEIRTYDQTTHQSLCYVGADKLAALKLVPAN